MFNNQLKIIAYYKLVQDPRLLEIGHVFYYFQEPTTSYQLPNQWKS